MKRFPLILVMMVAVSALLYGSAVAQDVLPSFSQLSEGWNILSPGGETTCAFGDPYRFFVHPGTENKLMLAFEGPFTCQDAQTCRALGTTNPYTYSVPDDDWRAYIGDVAGAEDFQENEGYLQLDHPDNPFQNYTVVFVPNCTFDANVGDNTVTYGEGDSAYTVNFKGYVNASAAMNWVYANVETPESIFLTGCDATVGASLFHVPNLTHSYGGVPLVQVGTSGARLRDDYSLLFEQWGTMNVIADIPAFADIAINELSVISSYIAAAAAAPDAIFADVNTAHDADQAASESNLPLSLADLHAEIPNFRSFTGWGNTSCILFRPDFYTHQVDGVRLRDWVAALAAGEDVEDVQCTNCTTPELDES